MKGHTENQKSEKHLINLNKKLNTKRDSEQKDGKINLPKLASSTKRTSWACSIAGPTHRATQHL